MVNVPIFFPCFSCKEPVVTIAGMSCFRCRMMANAFKEKEKRGSIWAYFVLICCLLAVMIGAVVMLSQFVPIGE